MKEINYTDKLGETMQFQHHELFKNIVEASPDPIAIHCDHKLVYINKTGADLLSSTVETLIGKSILEIVHPDCWDDSRNHVDQILREGHSMKTRNISLVGEDGMIVEVSINSTRTSYMGKPAVLISYRDITEQQRAEKELRESKELVTDILESITDAVVAVDNNWCITYLNQIGLNYIGKEYANLIGKNLWEEFPSLVETRFYEAYHKALTDKVVMEFEEYSPTSKLWYEVRAFPTKDGLTIYYKSISERKNAEEKAVYYAEEMAKSESNLEHIVNNMDAGVWSADLITGEYMISKGVEKLFGYPVHAYYEESLFWKKLIHPDDHHLVENQDQELFSGKSSVHKEGAEIPIDDSAAPILNDSGDMTGIVMVFRDVIERKRYEEKIKHYAVYDALTGLPNRRLINDRLTIALANAKRNNKRLATMFLDLDRFKLINDTLGHEIGDLLLIEVANRLLQSVRKGDTVARLGGDEFIILLEDIDDIELSRVIRRITDKLAEKFVVNNQELFTSSSIGTSFYPDDGEDVESLIKHADMAMYYVKSNGKNNHQFFAPFMNDKIVRKM